MIKGIKGKAPRAGKKIKHGAKIPGVKGATGDKGHSHDKNCDRKRRPSGNPG